MNEEIKKAFECMLTAKPQTIKITAIGTECLQITGKVSTHDLRLRITRMQPSIKDVFVDKTTFKTLYSFDCFVDEAMAFGNYEFGEATLPEFKKYISLLQTTINRSNGFGRQDAYNFIMNLA